MTPTLQDLLALPQPPADLLAWHELLSKGLPRKSAKTLARALGMSERDLLVMAEDAEPEPRAPALSREGSNFLYRSARVLSEALAKFGDSKRALQWLKSPQPLLKNQVPLQLLKCEVSASTVRIAIERS